MCSGHILIHTKKNVSGSDIQPKNYLALILFQKIIWLSYEHKKKYLTPNKIQSPPPWISNGPPLSRIAENNTA